MKFQKISSLIISLSLIFSIFSFIIPISSSNIEPLTIDLPNDIQEFIVRNYAKSLRLIASSTSSTSDIKDYTMMSPVFLITYLILQTQMAIAFITFRLQMKMVAYLLYMM